MKQQCARARTPMTIAPMMIVVALMMLATACSKGPEDTIANHMEKITGLLEDGTDDPVDAVEDLLDYVTDNLPELMRAYGEALVAVDQCEDDDCLDELVEDWEDALKEPLDEAQAAAEAFQEALEEDDEAGMAIMLMMMSKASMFEPFMDIAEELESSMEPPRRGNVCQQAIDHFFECADDHCAANPESPICGGLEDMRVDAQEELADCDEDDEEDAQEMLDQSCDALFGSF